jgi:phosphoribosylaminoimidazole-succinocarboxamide synthase
MPLPGQTLRKPFLDVSTKLEETDRYLSWQEAKDIAHLDEREIGEIKRITLLINEMIDKEAEKVGLKYEDGKIEFGFDEERNLIVIDVLGTLDECRFTFEEMPVSKEIARLYYRKTDWFKKLVEAKKRDSINWKEKVNLSPPPLPSRLRELISMAYCAFANEITGRVLFPKVPAMKAILEEIISFI